ncbi:hypothetical protein J4206_00470 [Candidatus Woesearchaeota archaeon]|nr:hypothetical protein [Candidatus Woesearchaeota archaeon]
MYIPKRYGMSKIDSCPFCQKNATTLNSQKVPVCAAHKQDQLDGLKCICGSTLDILNGKFGVFFSCMKCGNISLKKVLEFNTVKPMAKEVNQQRQPIRSSSERKETNDRKETSNRTEITIRSDDPRYFD